MFVAYVYGRKISPDQIDVGVALDNKSEQIKFVINKKNSAVFSNPGITAFFKVTTTPSKQKIPLSVQVSDTEITATWNVINSQIPQKGMFTGQLQIEAPNIEVDSGMLVWQSEPVRLNVVMSIETGHALTEEEIDQLTEFNDRLSRLQGMVDTVSEESANAIEQVDNMQEVSDALSAKVDTFDGRITAVEEQSADYGERIDAAEELITEYDGRLDTIEAEAVLGIKLDGVDLTRDDAGKVTIPWSAKQDKIQDTASGTTVSFYPAEGTFVYVKSEIGEPSSSGTPSVTAPIAINGLSEWTITSVNGTIGEKNVGDSVFIGVNGTSHEFIVVQHGKPSDVYDDSFTNGTMLMMKDLYLSRQWNSSNANDYENSTMHTYLNNDFFALIDEPIRSSIMQVKIPYRPGSGTSSVVNDGANGLSAKVFLASAYEVGFPEQSYMPDEGASLSYFSASDSAKRIAQLNGVATVWWLRSPRTNDATPAWRVNGSGNPSYSNCSNSGGIRPVFVLPSSTTITYSSDVYSSPRLDPLYAGDTIDTDGIVTRNYFGYSFDGTEDWNFSNIVDAPDLSYAMFRLTVPNQVDITAPIRSSHFVQKQSDQTLGEWVSSSNDGNVLEVQVSLVTISAEDTMTNDQLTALFKTWLVNQNTNATPVQIVYHGASAVSSREFNTILIPAKTGQNTITTNSLGNNTVIWQNVYLHGIGGGISTPPDYIWGGDFNW